MDGAWGELPHDAQVDGGDPGDDAWRSFLFDAKAKARFLIEVDAAEFSDELATVTDGDAWCAYASCEAPGKPVVLNQKTFMFGDGPWAGRPGDSVKPDYEADARIVASADIDRSIPLAPEASRRGEVAVGEVVLANADGGLDDIVSRHSVGGRRIQIRLGPSRGDYAAFNTIQDCFAQSWEAGAESVRLKLQSTTSFLMTPLQPRRYLGTGGTEGDAALAGRIMPSLWGECFNVTPVLMNRDQWIYQVHAGPIYAIDAVKERGLPFDFQENAATFAALRTLDVEGGYYATCLAEGLIKIGLGVAGPAGIITADVRGDAASGGYTDTTGEILLRMALSRARIDGGLIDRNSFNGLPRGRVGYFDDGSSEKTVATAFDELLRPILSYYGTAGSAALVANKPRTPTELSARRLDFDNTSILDIEDIGVEQQPRWAQSASYARNWTVIPEDQIAVSLDANERERLALPGRTVRRLAGEVQARHRSAIEGSVLETFFVERDPADQICQDAMELFRETRRRFRISVPRAGYIVNLGHVVRVTYPRFDFRNGKNMLVIGRRDNGGRGVIELTVWG